MLLDIAPSFTPDLWAAAILVIQRFKDLESPAVSAAYDAALPIYMPDADGAGRFPMLHQHPVAWFFFLADRLLAEHVHNRPHAGLTAARTPAWDQRRWLEDVLDDFRGRLAGQSTRGARPRPVFPALAAYLLRPVVDVWRRSGRERLAAQWSEVVRLWSVD